MLHKYDVRNGFSCVSMERSRDPTERRLFAKMAVPVAHARLMTADDIITHSVWILVILGWTTFRDPQIEAWVHMANNFAADPVHRDIFVTMSTRSVSVAYRCHAMTWH